MTLKELSIILYKHDPAGIIFAGPPRNEYDPEARMILPKLPSLTNVEDLSDALLQVFVQMFGTYVVSDKRGQCDSLAKEILEVLASGCTMCNGDQEVDTPDGTMECDCKPI